MSPAVHIDSQPPAPSSSVRLKAKLASCVVHGIADGHSVLPTRVVSWATGTLWAVAGLAERLGTLKIRHGKRWENDGKYEA